MMIWGDKRYHSLDYELKQTFGEKVYRLSLNGGWEIRYKGLYFL